MRLTEKKTEQKPKEKEQLQKLMWEVRPARKQKSKMQLGDPMEK